MIRDFSCRVNILSLILHQEFNNLVGILRVAEVYCVRALLAAVPAVRSLTGG